MIKKENPIAIIDSGVGGLTVVKELQFFLPQEDIIYFGDNKNVPYGSKTQEEIIALTRKMLDFLVERQVKLIGVGCNTISTVVNLVKPNYSLEIIGIIDPVITHISKLTGKKLGLIATPFTVKSQYYNQTLFKLNDSMEIISEGCPGLAALIDQGKFTEAELAEETKGPISKIKHHGLIDTIILGCTHYPIVTNYLQKLYPDINFINPAYYQALSIYEYLKEKNLLNDGQSSGSVEVFTTGEGENYHQFITRLGISNVRNVMKVQ